MKYIYKCKQCGKRFKSYNKTPKFCSLLCKANSQAPGIDIKKMKSLYVSGHSQSEVAALLNVSQKTIHKAMKRYKISARRAAKRNQVGKNNHMWKGDSASIKAFHKRLYTKFGKPGKCSVCGENDPKKSYDYANLSGRHHDINDYAPVCRSCHWRYDQKHLNFKGAVGGRPSNKEVQNAGA